MGWEVGEEGVEKVSVTCRCLYGFGEVVLFAYVVEFLACRCVCVRVSQPFFVVYVEVASKEYAIVGGSELLKFVVKFGEFRVRFVGRAVPEAE